MPQKLLVAFSGAVRKDPVHQSFIEDPRFEFIPISDITDLQGRKPDIMVFSYIGGLHMLREKIALHQLCRESGIVTIFWANEMPLMIPKIHDWSFTAYPANQRNMSTLALFYRFCLMYPDYAEKHDYIDFRNELKTKFCYFLYSNPGPQERIMFAKKLMGYKKIDCMGKVLNNMPNIPAHKINDVSAHKYLKNYKFGIAFENHSCKRYITEKIYCCFLIGAVPIYWGDPKVAEQINPASFINCHDFKNFDEVMAHVIEVDNNPELYQAYRNASPLLPDSLARQNGRDFLHQRIDEIVASVGEIRPTSLSYFYILKVRMFYWLSQVDRYHNIARLGYRSCVRMLCIDARESLKSWLIKIKFNLVKEFRQ